MPEISRADEDEDEDEEEAAAAETTQQGRVAKGYTLQIRLPLITARVCLSSAKMCGHIDTSCQLQDESLRLRTHTSSNTQTNSHTYIHTYKMV